MRKLIMLLTQHKPHLGLPRTWIISPKAMLKDPPSWDFRGRATTCHECTVFVKECFVFMAFPLKDITFLSKILNRQDTSLRLEFQRE